MLEIGTATGGTLFLFSRMSAKDAVIISIGLPEGKIVPQVKQFAEELSQKTGIPVIFQDETLTSQEAVAKMIMAGKRRKARREKEDAVAAALILQSYLDTHV